MRKHKQAKTLKGYEDVWIVSQLSLGRLLVFDFDLIVFLRFSGLWGETPLPWQIVYLSFALLLEVCWLSSKKTWYVCYQPAT